jgi:integrin alpha FG-GAP repeat containing protein 1
MFNACSLNCILVLCQYPIPKLISDADEKMDLLLPICRDAKCADSAIYAYSEGKWTLMISKFTQADKTYKFLTPDKSEGQPITLRVGDFNLDGYPDLVTILHTEDNG